MGEVFLHLPIQNKGDIGVQLFLKLKELHLTIFPRARLKHRQHKNILPGIMGKGIKHASALYAGTGGRGIGQGQIFADGNHWYNIR